MKKTQTTILVGAFLFALIAGYPALVNLEDKPLSVSALEILNTDFSMHQESAEGFYFFLGMNSNLNSDFVDVGKKKVLETQKLWKNGDLQKATQLAPHKRARLLEPKSACATLELCTYAQVKEFAPSIQKDLGSQTALKKKFTQLVQLGGYSRPTRLYPSLNLPIVQLLTWQKHKLVEWTVSLAENRFGRALEEIRSINLFAMETLEHPQSLLGIMVHLSILSRNREVLESIRSKYPEALRVTPVGFWESFQIHLDPHRLFQNFLKVEITALPHWIRLAQLNPEFVTDSIGAPTWIPNFLLAFFIKDQATLNQVVQTHLENYKKACLKHNLRMSDCQHYKSKEPQTDSPFLYNFVGKQLAQEMTRNIAKSLDKMILRSKELSQPFLK